MAIACETDPREIYESLVGYEVLGNAETKHQITIAPRDLLAEDGKLIHDLQVSTRINQGDGSSGFDIHEFIINPSGEINQASALRYRKETEGGFKAEEIDPPSEAELLREVWTALVDQQTPQKS